MELTLQHHNVPVAHRTPEWGWLEYLLQVSCQTSRLRLRAGWSVANRWLAAECEQRCRGLLQLHAWVPVAELPTSQSVEDICQNGFRAGHRGVSFHVGNVRLPGLLRDAGDFRRGRNLRRRGQSLPAGRHLYEFLLCRVGVGRAYLVDSVKQAEALELPAEYDSFFVRHDTAATDGSVDEEFPGVLPRHVLHHEYIVRDPTQVLPVYLVHFEYDPEAEERLALPLCDNCGVQAALLYCEADHAALCQACDAKIHSANTIAARHTRVDINRQPGNPLGRCPVHPEVEADRYCLECSTPLCMHCRSLGSHAAGEGAKHRTIGLYEAYDHALQAERQELRAALPDRQQVERRFVAELDSKLSAVQEAGQAAEDRVYAHIQQAVQLGQELAGEQATLILADELEAKRQLEQHAWLESFLEEELKALSPPDFLAAWIQHCGVREELAELGALAPARASAALRLEGGLRLLSEAQGQAPGGKGRGDGRGSGPRRVRELPEG